MSLLIMCKTEGRNINILGVNREFWIENEEIYDLDSLEYER